MISSAEDSAFISELASFTMLNIADTASAVLKSSSMAASKSFLKAKAFSFVSFSASVSSLNTVFSRRKSRFDTAFVILSSPVLAASISSWLKLIGPL